MKLLFAFPFFLMFLNVKSLAAAIESRSYHTVPGAISIEAGDRVPGQTRTNQFSATITLNLDANPATLSAFLFDAVLEGGAPFALAVNSQTATPLANGYRFTGEYLADSQYIFDWTFVIAPATGQLLWNGEAFWAGGHLWSLTLHDIVMVPMPSVQIAKSGSKFTIFWLITDGLCSVESSPTLGSDTWTVITEPVTVDGDYFTVAITPSPGAAFFRLLKILPP